jgi:hypothetical protein
MAGKSFIRKVDSDSPSEEKKFSCHVCAKSFKKVMSFLSVSGSLNKAIILFGWELQHFILKLGDKLEKC